MTMELNTQDYTCVCEKNRPAEFSLLGQIGNYITRLWLSVKRQAELRKKNKASREALSSLTKLDDRALKDIGITRADVDWAAGLPYETNASEALNEIRARNIANTRWNVMHKEIKRR